MSINSICLIDDDPIFVFGTKVILNNNSEFCSSILVYENGREALESLTALLKSENQIPEVIFLDLNSANYLKKLACRILRKYNAHVR